MMACVHMQVTAACQVSTLGLHATFKVQVLCRSSAERPVTPLHPVPQEYYEKYRRQAHVTPKSYLSFIAGFKALYTSKLAAYRDLAASITSADLAANGRAELVTADLEAGPWPLTQNGAQTGPVSRQFDLVVVTNYLWRPLWPQILASLAPHGALICETFAQGQESVGRPSRADFLLRHGELLQCCEPLHIVAYENGFQPQPEKFVQRVAAVRPDMTLPNPVRYPLSLE